MHILKGAGYQITFSCNKAIFISMGIISPDCEVISLNASIIFICFTEHSIYSEVYCPHIELKFLIEFSIFVHFNALSIFQGTNKPCQNEILEVYLGTGCTKDLKSVTLNFKNSF